MSRSPGFIPCTGSRAAGTALCVLLALSCGAPQEDATPAAEPVAAAQPADLLVDIAPECGIDFVHTNGMSGQHYFAEPVGAGGALADLDNDGDLDVYIVQGRFLGPPGTGESGAEDGPGHDGGRLFRNDLSLDEEGRPHLEFTDVTAGSGLEAHGYGMGVATGDYDNDGRVDLYLTNLGSNQLWRNVSDDGQIRFTDVTAEAGVDDPRWSTSASFADLDADGWLDLYVANYVDYSIENHRPCRSPGGREDYCGPASFDGEPDRLLHNRGDGTFEDITGPSGMLAAPSSGLGVVTADFDLDGRLDVYVGNDMQRNFLWHNLGNQGGIPRFEDIALECGSAVSMLGHAQASMGVVAADLDNDGDEDLFMAHLSGDTNTLYINNGRAVFDDRSAMSRLGAPSLATTCFGAASFDLDNDGWLDLMAAAGEIRLIEALVLAGDPYPLKQPNLLFRNNGDGTFANISAEGGVEFTRLEVSRGLAVGDVDNDGKSDILLVNNNGPARLLHNRSTGHSSWVGLRLLTRDGIRDALGARIEVRRSNGPPLWRRVATDGSYLSARDPRVLVGLGPDAEVTEVRVVWPWGEAEAWTGLATGRYHTLQAGHGQRVAEETAS